MSRMNIVVVESPAKAKTINKYLGRDYKVVASYGHIRDLPAKDGSVLPDADFAMSWEVDVKPVVFNEVTRNAVLDAFRHPREIDGELVEAYLARRALDYLVGFTLSPVLWRKLPGSRSAGRVQSVALRQVHRHPFPPFTTSTLQQEASRQLGLGASRTMRIAQRLYEGIDLEGDTVGLITYMRTDGVAIAAEAIAAARGLIGSEFGPRYVPGEPRVYRSPAKNAQEAHEAIRPTDLTRRPGDVARHLDNDHRRLYELIWKRTVASQMASALLDQASIDIADQSGRLRLHATGSVVLFDGFLQLYQEDRDDAAEEEGEGRRLPNMRERERLARGAVDPAQHFTQPPPRYSEASLVKKLEELGIGRPSTYASILQVLQDRE